MRRARLGIVAVIWLIGFMVIVMGLLAIQLIGWQPWNIEVKGFQELAIRQQMTWVALDTGRPIYLDRNGEQLHGEWQVQTWGGDPCSHNIRKWVSAGVNTVGRQVIGVATKELGGVVGLERVMEKWLPTREPMHWLYMPSVDARLNEECRLNYVDRSQGRLPFQVQSTIWRALQQRVEHILVEKRVTRGTIVVLDARNADVLAMASMPNWGIRASTWREGALQLFPPGSIFKLVSWLTYAKQVPSSSWFVKNVSCLGNATRLNGVKCWSEVGHGNVNSIDALVHSCNRWFAAHGNDFAMEQLEKTGRELGLFQPIGYPDQWIHEPAGQLVQQANTLIVHPMGNEVLSAIGQADVLISPLQAANLMVTILNHGQVGRPRLIKSIQFSNGLIFREFPTIRHRSASTISAHAFSVLKMAMRETVHSGTAEILNVSTENQISGKTGTAQFGARDAEGRYRAHHWFVGYFPSDRPRYAFAIIVEAQQAEISSKAIPIVASLWKEIHDLNAKK